VIEGLTMALRSAWGEIWGFDLHAEEIDMLAVDPRLFFVWQVSLRRLSMHAGFFMCHMMSMVKHATSPIPVVPQTKINAEIPTLDFQGVCLVKIAEEL